MGAEILLLSLLILAAPASGFKIPQEESKARVSTEWLSEDPPVQYFAKVYAYAAIDFSKEDLSKMAFVRISSIRPGNVLFIPRLTDNTPYRNFSTEAAARLHLPAEEQLQHLGVASTSPAYRPFVDCFNNYCGGYQVSTEQRTCFARAGEMVDFLSHYSNSTTVAQPSSFPDHEFNMTITSVQELPNIVTACHSVLFPVAVYSCHVVQGVEGFLVSGVPRGTGSNTTREVILVCHINTASFNPGAAPFLALGTKPGDDFCHYYADSDLMLLQK